MDEAMSAKAEILASIVAALPPSDGRTTLVPLLFARPPAEDLSAFPPAALAIAAERALVALERHRGAEPVVLVERPEGFCAGGAPLELITVVNPDMAFLFDSVTGEIAEQAPGIRYISHPILDVVRGADGAVTGFSSARFADKGQKSGERTSLIQVAIDPVGDATAAEALREALKAILAQVAHANADFEAMRRRVGKAVVDLRARAGTRDDEAAKNAVEESAKLLEWLRDDNFIFLGMREYDYVGEANAEALERRDEPGLGILRDPNLRILKRAGIGITTTPEIRAFLEAPDPLIVTKSNARSLVHRRAYMDYVGVKQYAADGSFAGELRIVGLFTSSAYTRSILTIPYLRLKAETVIARFGLGAGSHSAKALLNALESYPRDELFQIDVDRLEEFLGTIIDLGERPRVRVLPRIDRFDRFVSILVFVPRDRYDSRLRERMGMLLAEAYDGHLSAYYPAFPEGPLARVHFIVGRTGGKTPDVDPARLEARIADMAKNWEDEFLKALVASGRSRGLADFAAGLPDSYRDAIAPREAVADTACIASLSEASPLSIDFYRRPGDGDDIVRLKLYHLGAAVALSTRVPILENMGFGVVSERTFRVARPAGDTVHLHDMDLVRRLGGDIALADAGDAFQETFQAVWSGRIENDGFNALVLEAGLAFEEANVLRAYARYLRQTGLAYSPDYLAAVLIRQPAIARLLWQLFDDAFDPAKAEARDEVDPAAEASIEPEGRQRKLAAERGGLKAFDAIGAALDEVESLDDDRILRRYLSTILATLRTNYYATTISADPGSKPGAVSPALAFKLDSKRVEGLPEPVPFREIFVFDARVEGVHLRFGKVARGGLRWSDRAQDYRTEVLGLVKAQQVKNAVIVPVGAKGGFYPQRLPVGGSREEWFEAGRSAYVVFVASLLSVTDNIVGEAVVTPANVVRFDEEDPYFVVAADKGTATFSDTANAIAQSEDFWLDDAFASGGSAGYDHKAMGITARGAWEAVKRHFREMGKGGKAWDIQKEPFTVVGCGDMSGDVFGNGMILSRQTKLIAAFDHRDIFIDPNPDPEVSFDERKRLYDTPRSSWADYEHGKISAGGGVFSRKEKQVRLSKEAAEAIGWDRQSGTPSEVIAAILKAPVDLLWFGGIGTYVRSSAEPNAEVGDRANDAVRITAREIRAKVVGEGANLGVTQRGRIEYAAGGGRINSDAIDNSAGVNTSDVEVNIKIALKGAMAAGRLSRPDRDTLLSGMTGEVAELVLRNNYEQTLAISLEQRDGAAALPLQARFMAILEEAGTLNREVETLPNEAALADRKAAGRGLTRPEIGVLLAYAKIVLFDQLVASDLPDDPYLNARLLDYFPAPMRKDFAADIDAHRLHREIVATVLANESINRVGPTFVTAVADATGASPAEIIRAFVAAKDALGASALYASVDALDGKVHGETQNALYAALGDFLRRVSRWFAQNAGSGESLGETIARIQATLEDLKPRLLDLASDRAREEAEHRQHEWAERGIGTELAAEMALLPLIALVPDIAAVSRETSTPLERTIAAYFAITRLFRIGRLEAALASLKPGDYFENLAVERASSQIERARRRLTTTVLRDFAGEADPVAAWEESRKTAVGRIGAQIAQLAGSGDTSVARLTVAAGLLSDLAG